jgi:hypothetical protein
MTSLEGVTCSGDMPDAEKVSNSFRESSTLLPSDKLSPGKGKELSR